MTYIVHGASGAQGSPVLAALRADGHHATAAVRDTASVDGPAVAADYSSVDSLVNAYQGAAGVFVHLPVGSPDYQLSVASNLATALSRADVPRVVMSTSGYPLAPGTGPAALVDSLAASGRSFAALDPKLFLENLLLPSVLDTVRLKGVLRYPVRADYELSWISHLDVADAAVRLLLDHDVNGRVSIGALPPLVGSDLAAGFANHFRTSVSFEAQDPEDFGQGIIPLFGEQAARPVIDAYIWRQNQQSEVIDEDVSTQRVLGLEPRSVDRWLSDIAI